MSLKKFSSVKIANIVCGIISVTAFILCIPLLVLLGYYDTSNGNTTRVVCSSLPSINNFFTFVSLVRKHFYFRIFIFTLIFLFWKANTLSYSIIPSFLIIGANSLLIYEFIHSKKKVYTNEQLIHSKSFRSNLRSTIRYSFVYSFSFVVISLPKMLTLVIALANINNNIISPDLTKIFDVQGNLYYVFNFCFLAIMNKPFLNEIKSIFRTIGLLKTQHDNTSILMTSTRKI